MNPNPKPLGVTIPLESVNKFESKAKNVIQLIILHGVVFKFVCLFTKFFSKSFNDNF